MSGRIPSLEAKPATVAIFALLATLKAGALVGVAQAVASGVSASITEPSTVAVRDAALLGILSGILLAIVSWATPLTAVWSAAGIKEQLRTTFAKRMLAGPLILKPEYSQSDPEPVDSAGGVSVLATVGLDELDHYYRTVIPAVITAATVPLLIGMRILFADWLSAIIVLVTVPLVPVFMALVGMHTQDRADAVASTLQRLSDHLVELAQGLPVLIGLGRNDETTAALRDVSDRHRKATMLTLRTAFLSSLVLELIATISVAVVAVFIGVRLVHGDLSLEIGLLVLIIAPECFAPFRELGAAFHASQDGLAALRRIRVLNESDSPIDIRKVQPQSPDEINNPNQSSLLVEVADGETVDSRITIKNLSVKYPGSTSEAIINLSTEIHPGSFVAIEGPSGSGKSSVLKVLAGTSIAQVSGTILGIDPQEVAWVPQHPHTFADTVRGELKLYYRPSDNAKQNTGHEITETLLAKLNLTSVSDVHPAQLSPGELRRLSVARGLMRVACGAHVLLLDEPTAHLDADHARLVEDAISALRGSVTVIFASHETGMTRLADTVIRLKPVHKHRDVTSITEEVVIHNNLHPGEQQSDTPTAPLRELRTFLKGFNGPRLVGGVLLGAGATLFASTLTALSGWLIVRASEHPPIMYLTMAVVGVRFFGIGRAVLRYTERLLLHGGILAALTELRVRLWRGLAKQGASNRVIATGASALEYLIHAADRVRDLVPRVILPIATASLITPIAIVTVLILENSAGWLIALTLLVGYLLAPLVALLLGRAAGTRRARTQSNLLAHFTNMSNAISELRGNDVEAAVLECLERAESNTVRATKMEAFAIGVGRALVIIATTCCSMLMLTIADVPGTVLGVLVLLPLALSESMIATVDAVQQWPALRSALSQVSIVTIDGEPSTSGDIAAKRFAASNPETIESLELNELAVGWRFGASHAPVSATVRPGQWLVVEGASGSGKTTLLMTLLGFLPPHSGTVTANRGRTSSSMNIAWCPQEGHLFDSTVRGNLLVARSINDAPTEEELWRVLRIAGLADQIRSLGDGLDSRVGSRGARLSGGERQRLAVARTLLAPANVVLLDEPTAHLDDASAQELLNNLRAALSDRIVVLVTHHAGEGADDDIRIRL